MRYKHVKSLLFMSQFIFPSNCFTFMKTFTQKHLHKEAIFALCSHMFSLFTLSMSCYHDNRNQGIHGYSAQNEAVVADENSVDVLQVSCVE